MTLLRIRIAVALAASLLVSTLALAHSSMNLAVTVEAPPFVAASQTARIPIKIDNEAFDPAVAVVVTIDTDAQFTSYAAPSAWRCTRETKRVRCTVDELEQGPHTFTVDVAVPGSGSVKTSAGIESIASDDPDFSNNNSSVTSSVYTPSSCTAAAPVIVSTAAGANGAAEVSWSPSAGASSYEVLAAVDGETLRVLTTTTATSASSRLLGGGEIQWIVRAKFAHCPALDSAAATMTSDAAPARLSVSSLASPLLVEPVSVAFWRNAVLIADAGRRGLLIHYHGQSVVFDEPLDGDVKDTPLAADGGIAVGPGEYLYLADRDNELVRYAYPSVPRYVFSLAGSPRSAGAADGAGTSVRFRSPQAVAVDNRTRIYISDSGNHTIRRGVFDAIKWEFAVVTLAGAAGQSGSANGTGAAARFNDPAGLAIDSQGNVYIADRGNHTIRRMTPAGEVTTIAGVAGEAGHRDGTAPQALFNRPIGVAVDTRGSVLVTEEGNHTVRKIAPNGRVTTVAGQPGAAGNADGTGAAARFHSPAMLAIAPDGTIWIADSGNGTLRHAVFTPPPGPKRRSARN